MKLQHKVMLNTAVSLVVLFSSLAYLHGNQARTVALAHDAATQAANTNGKPSPAVDAQLREMQRRLTLTRNVSLALVVFVLLERAFVILGSLLPMARSSRDVVNYAKRIAQGDLSGGLEHAQKNEIGVVIDSLNEMKTGLAQLVHDIAHTAANLREAAQRVNTGSVDLSQRTEEQAASLEQTAATIEQFSASLRQSADGAERAHHLTRDATQAAQQGGAAVASAVTTMQDIQDSAQRVAAIVALIDDIAFQTNVLALNAAVEAARAGEQGRGFNVVAAEVRRLSQRSAQAAKEARSLIEQSNAKVVAGVGTVSQAGQHMQQIVDTINRANDHVSGIATASAQQQAAVTQINTTVDQLQRVTAHNGNLVQQSALVAESLSEQARRLVDLISRFQLQRNANTALTLR